MLEIELRVMGRRRRGLCWRGEGGCWRRKVMNRVGLLLVGC